MSRPSLPQGVNMIEKIVVRTADNRTMCCTHTHCFNFVYLKCSDDKVRCSKCMKVRVHEEGEVEGPFPRPNMEFWDRFNQLPSYAFLKSSTGCVVKTEMSSGLYKEGYEAGRIVEEAQSEINSLRERLARLEPKEVNNGN